jgi:polyisoprenoid-binding protein YceI
LALFVVGSAGSAFAATFAFSPGGLSQAIFNSDAPLESITGTSNAITGQVQVDLSNPGDASGTIVIDAASFRTGIDDRDEHLRGAMWIDAASFPEIRFEVTSVTVPEGTTLASATPVQGEVTGELTFHGVTHTVTAQAEVGYYIIDEETRMAGQMTGLIDNALRIVSEIEFNLSDYGISIPPVLDLKVADTISFTLRVTGIEQQPS